ncbi:hypothetical protein MUGA111182_11475 [Mucilaginibacter galii]|uniref:Uncharacterized protein n=1 Tax=Mucilaginibacter galii TaxID=2005073 RepID=A0A917J9W1_9SPHI|nr:hypothetical protein [Mucilaginibacter galii]GGI50597.1 hypothetical protein GCM10011425_18090 [Mucilaginibacter galii]
MKTKILTISTLMLMLVCVTFVKAAYAGYFSKYLESYNRSSNLNDNNVFWVEPTNGYISFSATVTCTSNPSDYSSAEVVMWGDISGYDAHVHVPENGAYYQTTSNTIYPSSAQGGWLEASLYANGYGSTAYSQVSW